MAKKKESFFERLIKKNAEQEGQGKVPKKRKSWKIIVFSSLLAAAVVIGISVPIVVNSTKIKTIDKPSKDEVLAKISNNGNSSFDVTAQDIDNIYKPSDASGDFEADLQNIYKSALYYLYNIEQKASLQYQNLYNASIKDGEAIKKDIALKSIKELKEKYTNELNDIYDNLVKTFGNKADSQFNQILVSQYNNAKTKEEAVNNKVFDAIKSDALRSFRLVTKDISNLFDRKTNRNVYKLDENGNPTSDILVKQGAQAFENKYIEGDNYFDIVSGNKNIKMSFTTDSFSFDKKFKDADKFVAEYVQNNVPYIVSQFTLPGVAPEKKNGLWKIDRSKIRLLLMFKGLANDGDKKFPTYFDSVKNNFNNLTQYINQLELNKNNNVPVEVQKYLELLKKISKDDDNIKDNFGTKGITSLMNMLQSDEGITKVLASPDFNKLLLGSTKAREIDLFKTLQDIQSNLGVSVPTQTSDVNANANNIIDWTKKVWDKFDNPKDNNNALSEDEYKTKVVKPLSDIFTNSDGSINTFYTIKNMPDTYAVLTSNGITLYKYEMPFNGLSSQDEKVNKIKKMIKSDFVIKNQYIQNSNITYNALAQINHNELTSINYIIDQLTNSSVYKDAFRKHLKEDIDSGNIEIKSIAKNLSQSAFDSALDELVGANGNKKELEYAKIKSAINVIKQTSTYLDTRAQKDYDSYFKIENYKTKFTNNDSKDAATLLLEEIKKVLPIFKTI